MTQFNKGDHWTLFGCYSLSVFLIHMVSHMVLAQGQTQGSTLTMHQQALTTGPFGNTYGEDAISLEVAIGGCRTHVSTTRGNASGFKRTTHKDLVIPVPT
jgi:hypothetical protein